MVAAVKILTALRRAAEWHVDQRRKGAAREPYVNHLIEVADLVASAGASEDVICAAVLHDVIEDQDVTAATLAALFGADVAAMVVEVTDDQSLPKAERKARQIAIAPRLTPGARLIRLADKIANVRSIASSPPVGWSSARLLEYLEFCSRVVAGLRGTDAALEKTFDDEVRNALAECRAEAAT